MTAQLITWNDRAAKSAILDFVTTVSKRRSSSLSWRVGSLLA
jgi:hypothetical protein